MLPRQQCRRRNDRDLKTRHRRCKSRAHRDFGFSKADIAAHEPVHGFACGQILKHFFNNAQLIFGFLIRETVDKAGIGRTVDFNDRTRTKRTFGRGFKQFAGDCADAFFQLRLAPLPCLTAQLVERHMLAVGTIT